MDPTQVVIEWLKDDPVYLGWWKTGYATTRRDLEASLKRELSEQWVDDESPRLSKHLAHVMLNAVDWDKVAQFIEDYEIQD